MSISGETFKTRGGCLNLALRKKTEPISKHKHVNSDDDDNDDDDYGYNDYVMKLVRPLWVNFVWRATLGSDNALNAHPRPSMINVYFLSICAFACLFCFPVLLRVRFASLMRHSNQHSYPSLQHGIFAGICYRKIEFLFSPYILICTYIFYVSIISTVTVADLSTQPF